MQVVIAYDPENGKARYVGNKLKNQNEKNERLLIFEASEIDCRILKKYKNNVIVEEKYKKIEGTETYHKVFKLKIKEDYNTKKQKKKSEARGLDNKAKKTFSAKNLNQVNNAV